MLYMIASLNTVILMAVCAHTGISPRYYLWMSGMVLLAVVRSVIWNRRKHTTLSPDAVSSALRRSAWIGTTALAIMGVFTSYTFASGVFQQSLLIPISLAFGSMSIAHCFATLRPSAIAALTLGIIPSAAAMILTGDFNAQVLGVSMLSVAALMIRFVAVQFDQVVTEVRLQREVYDLANTDALTGVPNRRAVVAMAEKELAVGAGNRFALVLLDLDGFKSVNDTLGHIAGDALLRVVAARLSQTCAATDTVGRLGGDEFLVIFRAVKDSHDVETRMRVMMETLCQPAPLDTGTVMVRSSAGCAVFPDAGNTVAALLATADEALYANKRERTAARSPADAVTLDERRRHRAS